jgi:thiamine-monophosphate kinase
MNRHSQVSTRCGDVCWRKEMSRLERQSGGRRRSKAPAEGRGELSLISAIRKRARSLPTSPEVRLGIGDDCAILRPRAGAEVVVTTDLSLENVHFRRDWHPAEAVGHRCLARGLSDLAAMGAAPLAAFLSFAVPAELTRKRGSGASWMDRFLDGFFALAELHGVPLAGGDLAQAARSADGTSLAAADIILLGSTPRGRALLRSTAKAGDAIYVTGSLGGAAAELQALEKAPRRFKAARATEEHPHLFPRPRLSVGRSLLARKMATAAIDLSDGLSTDLQHLCEESGLRAEIDAAAIPIHVMAALAESAGWVESGMKLALHGGEDYELLFTASPATGVPKRIEGVRIHRIGQMLPLRRDRPCIGMHDGKRAVPLQACGWQHFRSR